MFSYNKCTVFKNISSKNMSNIVSIKGKPYETQLSFFLINLNNQGLLNLQHLCLKKFIVACIVTSKMHRAQGDRWKSVSNFLIFQNFSPNVTIALKYIFLFRCMHLCVCLLLQQCTLMPAGTFIVMLPVNYGKNAVRKILSAFFALAQLSAKQ